MLLFTQGEDPGIHFLSEIDRLAALVADMKGIRRGVSLEDLVGDHPPILDRWIIAGQIVPCLAGFSTGHPQLPGTNRMINTSDIWLMSRDRAWARTLSRWYRLGRPATRTELDS